MTSWSNLLDLTTLLTPPPPLLPTHSSPHVSFVGSMQSLFLEFEILFFCFVVFLFIVVLNFFFCVCLLFDSIYCFTHFIYTYITKLK